jgi:hypothetical protein
VVPGNGKKRSKGEPRKIVATATPTPLEPESAVFVSKCL